MHFKAEMPKMIIMSTIAHNPINSKEFMATAEYDSDIVKTKNANVNKSRQTDQKMFKKYKNLFGKLTQKRK
jgi:hypothetical protein